ncbi:MAG: ethanolamine utilization protein EutJ [Actinomycetota bacterium]|jgi:ethanolamine utilization protein EutJ
MTLRLAPAPALAEFLERAAASGLAASPADDWSEPLHCGVDLGTATIVLAVVDSAGDPVYCDAVASAAVRDGVVVDFHGAAELVARLKERAEDVLGRTLEEAATAYPPGVGANESRACQFVLERAGLDCTELIDEVSAANALLGVKEGVVVDVGGGSTGVGIIRGGLLIDVGDLPGGGHHLNLILAGALGIGIEEAEQLKREEGAAYLHVLRPGLERVATNIERLSRGAKDLPVHLVGGALMIRGAGDVIAQYLERPVVEYPHALLITPFGIARSCLS